MKLKSTPDFYSFLVSVIADSDGSNDTEATQSFIESASPDQIKKLFFQAKTLLSEDSLPVDEFGSEANRWFADSAEASAWLQDICSLFEQAVTETKGDETGVLVKDCNGAVLNEGDSVQVIKDLKVKGGSSDLKRGTLVKKIHLIDDPDAIECRVEGSTLVLKTCFLKKV